MLLCAMLKRGDDSSRVLSRAIGSLLGKCLENICNGDDPRGRIQVNSSQMEWVTITGEGS